MASTLRMLLITVALCALVASVVAPRRPKDKGAGSSGNTETDEEKKARLQKYIDDQKVASDAWKSAKDGLDKQIEQSDPMKSANQQAPPGFIKYETQSWLANRWSRIGCSPCLQLSANGLNIKRKPNCHGDWNGITYTGFIRTIYGVEFPPTYTSQMGIAQVGYFEMKFIKGTFTYGFCAKDYIPGLNTSNLFRLMSTTGHYINGADKHWLWLPHKHQELIPYDETAVVGCGLLKHLGQRKIFFTRNGQLLANPIALPLTASAELFPFIHLFKDDTEFEDTNFGHRPFVFKFEHNLDVLSQE